MDIAEKRGEESVLESDDSKLQISSCPSEFGDVSHSGSNYGKRMEVATDHVFLCDVLLASSEAELIEASPQPEVVTYIHAVSRP